jgi:hypothetical protein
MSIYSGEIKLDNGKHNGVEFGASWLEIHLFFCQTAEHVEEGRDNPESDDVTDEGYDITSTTLHYVDEDGIEQTWPIDWMRLPTDRQVKIYDHINRLANNSAFGDELTEEE